MAEHFGDVFKEYLQMAGETPAPLARRTGLPKETLINWRKGRVKQPKRWQDIALVASVLGLKVDAATRLLQSAGYPAVVELIEDFQSKEDTLLLQSWIEELGARDRFLAMLPQRPINFTNRVVELADLVERLHPGNVITLCGPGGIGKTALASELLYRLVDDGRLYVRFPDGVIFYSFYGRSDSAGAFEHIIKSYEPQARDFSAKAVTRLLNRKKALLVLDGTEEATDLPDVLAVVGPCAVIITSRRRQDAPGRFQDLAPLTEQDALRLLRSWGPQQIDSQAAAERICELIGYLPLAVRLVGRYLSVTGEAATDYLSWLTETPLQALDPDGVQRREGSVPWLLERSLAQVGDLAKQVLGVIGLLALAPFSREEISAALPGISVAPLLNQFVAYGLLLRVGTRYEVSHALVHTYGRYRLPANDETVIRLAEYYCLLAAEQTKLGQKGYTQLDGVRAHFIPVLSHCLAREQWETVQKLTKAVDKYLGDQGHWVELVKIVDMALTAARASKNLHNEVGLLARKGLTLNLLGQVKQAILVNEESLSLAQKIGDRQGEARNLSHLGIAYNNLGQMERAIEFHQRALLIRKEIDDKMGETQDLGNLGTAYFHMGQIELSIDYHQQALALAKELEGAKYMVASWLNNLGNLYQTQGDVEKGKTYLHQSIVVAQEVGRLDCLGDALINLGVIALNARRMEEAEEFYEKALDIKRQMGHKLSIGICLHNLGELYEAWEKYTLARRYLRQSLAVFDEVQSSFALESRKLLEKLEAYDL